MNEGSIGNPFRPPMVSFIPSPAMLKALSVLMARALSRFKPTPRSPDHDLGRRGEDVAAHYLRRAGYRIIERNVRVPMGEADIIAETRDAMVMIIVEVKSRLRTPGQPELSATVAPEAAITAHKRRKLATIAQHLARANRWHDRTVRIDVIAVEFFTLSDPQPLIRHHPAAVPFQSVAH